MIEYPKIETLFDRHPDTHLVMPAVCRLGEFDLVDAWLVTEKVDGMNARLHWSWVAAIRGGSTRVGGRTDRAQLTPQQTEFLFSRAADDRFAYVFDEQLDRDLEVTVYGELYGPQVQSGGWYRDDLGFRVFDVRVNEWWLDWPDVEDVSKKLGLTTVPVLGDDLTLSEAANYVSEASRVQQQDRPDNKELRRQEGIVARTVPQLYTKRGQRVMWKLKGRDFKR